MSLDLKLAVISLTMGIFFLLMPIGMAIVRRMIDGPLLQSEHAFYVMTTGEEPKCATCPMNKRCPYYGNGRCKFAKIKV